MALRKKKIIWKNVFDVKDLAIILINMLKWNIFLKLHLLKRVGIKILKRVLYDLCLFLETVLGFSIFTWFIIEEEKRFVGYLVILESITKSFCNLLNSKLNFILVNLNFKYGVDLKGFVVDIGIQNINGFYNNVVSGNYEFFDSSTGYKKFEILLKKGLKFQKFNFVNLNNNFINFLSIWNNEFKTIFRISRVEELSVEFIDTFLTLINVEKFFWFVSIYNYHTKTHSKNETVNKYFYYIGIDKKLSKRVIENAWWNVYKILNMNLREIVKRYKKYVEVDNYLRRFKEIEIFFSESWTSEEFYFFLWKDYKIRKAERLSICLEKKYSEYKSDKNV